MTKDVLIETIQHLLVKTVARGCTEAEAQAALAKAQELMLEHNLSMVEVQQTEIGKRDWVTEESYKGRGLPWDLQYVAPILQKYFFVKVVYMRGYRGSGTVMKLFGNKENVEVAKHLCIFLSRTFRNLWRQYREQTATEGHGSRAYYAGLSKGLSERLSEEREVKITKANQANALMVLSNQLTEAFTQLHPGTRPMGQKPAHGRSEYTDGKRQGKQINIHKVVTGGGRKRLDG